MQPTLTAPKGSRDKAVSYKKHFVCILCQERYQNNPSIPIPRWRTPQAEYSQFDGTLSVGNKTLDSVRYSFLQMAPHHSVRRAVPPSSIDTHGSQIFHGHFLPDTQTYNHLTAYETSVIHTTKFELKTSTVQGKPTWRVRKHTHISRVSAHQ